MRRIGRIAALGAVAAMGLSGLAACSSGSSSSTSGDSAGSVYYLNFKPESEQQWKDVAAKYKEATGVDVKIVTAASGTYEQTLKSEVAKSDGPTLFNINGPVGYQTWKDYTLDLKDTDFARALTDKSLAVTDGDSIYGVPFAIEGYGIIYNKAILDKYFALSGAKAASVDEINNFDKLKAVADDMQSKKDQLGIKGAFASTSFAPGEDWRWQTHLANYPVFYEFRDDGVSDAKEIKGTYFDNFKKILDLYVTDSTVPPAETSAKTVTDSMSEFALGQAAFVQNGEWAWSQIADVQGNVVKPEDVHFLPIYVGVSGEEKAGIAVGTENFMAVNAKASQASQKASIDFLNWLFNSDEGAKLVSGTLNFSAPFQKTKDMVPSDPLGKEVVEYANNKDLYPVNWVFTVFPSQDFKDQLGQHMAQYVSGKEDWASVTTFFKDEWKAEKATE
ncbi:MAG: ABC transporter substrate-binding protein [Actinomycetaceae bacterium]|nr:ABC transporter substrate-binding protein [Actinomycetaceae bacterium]MDY6083503.1 ABC transporter substrate-binding protein [Actinomycetaceae bacterium]